MFVALHNLFESGSSLLHSHQAQVGAVEVQKVEQVVDDALTLASVERVLQQLKIGDTVSVRDDKA